MFGFQLTKIRHLFEKTKFCAFPPHTQSKASPQSAAEIGRFEGNFRGKKKSRRGYAFSTTYL